MRGCEVCCSSAMRLAPAVIAPSVARMQAWSPVRKAMTSDIDGAGTIFYMFCRHSIKTLSIHRNVPRCHVSFQNCACGCCVSKRCGSRCTGAWESLLQMQLPCNQHPTGLLYTAERHFSP